MRWALLEKGLLSKNCPRCGAPLVQKNDELFCPYCRSSFKLPKEYINHYSATGPTHPSTVPVPPLPPVPARVNSVYTPAPPAKRQRKSGCQIFAILLGAAVLILTLMILLLQGAKFNLSNLLNGNSMTESQLYGELNLSNAQYPSAFIPGQPLSILAVVARFDDSDPSLIYSFGIEIAAKNELSRNIQLNLKTDQLAIESYSLVDNFNNSYTCNIDNPYVIESQSILKPGNTFHVGNLYCVPVKLPADVKYLRLNLTFTNWGSYEFQIPFDTDMSALKIDYTLNRRPDSVEFEARFSSDKAQLVAINYRDISLIDSKGNSYPLQECNDPLSIKKFDKNSYFFALASPSSPLSPELRCTFSQPVPDDVNAVTLVYTLRGNTVTHTFATDTIQ